MVLNSGGKKKKSAVILPEERGYIAGRARLNSRKSAIIFWLIGVILNNANNSGHLRLWQQPRAAGQNQGFGTSPG